MGAENYVISCDLGIFVDQATEPVAPQHMDTRTFLRVNRFARRRILVQRSVWPVGVVVIGVLTKDEPQMPFTGDQHPAQALAAGAADLAIGDRVRARRQHRCPDGTHSDGGEHGVERCGERVPVTDQELELCGLIAKIHEQVAGRPDLLTQPPETPLARQTWAIS